MKIRYDFHIHSCLSPCAEDEMTPNNIVNMALLLGLDAIALTDHNAVGNCGAVMAAGEAAGVLVLPGMELCTAEEIHVVCLFADLPAARDFEARIREGWDTPDNRPEIFGRQQLLDAEDEAVGEETKLLLTASPVSVDEVAALAASFGGVAFPAHVDRDSYSVLSVFGFLGPELGFSALEYHDRTAFEACCARDPAMAELISVTGSDAHRLEDFRDENGELEVERADRESVLKALGKRYR